MRIVDIREKTIPLNAAMTNAAISFDDMTASIVAVVSDVVRGGKPVVGYALDSLGRYAHGSLLMERFAPRVLAADPAELFDADGLNIDPVAVWGAAMRNEKPGGHGERAGAVGLLDTAVWDLVAKLDDKPLWRVLAELYGNGRGPEDGGSAPTGQAVTTTQTAARHVSPMSSRECAISVTPVSRSRPAVRRSMTTGNASKPRSRSSARAPTSPSI